MVSWKPLSAAQVINLCSPPGGGAVSTHWGPEDIQANDTPGPSRELQTAPTLVRENSRDLMPPPPVTPKRNRRTLPAEIPSSQSPTHSPLRTQHTQTQPPSQSSWAVGMGIVSSQPLKTATQPAGLRVVKSSQWWENVDTQDTASDTASESEAEDGASSGPVARDQVSRWQRSQIPATQDDSDSAPLSPVPLQTSKSPRAQGAGTKDGASAGADPTTVPGASPHQQAHPEHVGSTLPAFEPHRPPSGSQAQQDGRTTEQRESVAEAASPFAAPRESQIQQHLQFCHDDDDDDDADMTFGPRTPCSRVSPPKHSLSPAFSPRKPRTPSPSLPDRAKSPAPLHRVREHSPSPYRRSSLGTTAFRSPSTARETAPSSLTSFTVSPRQQPTESQLSSVQETPLKKRHPFSQQAEDIILGTCDNKSVLSDDDDDDDDATQSQDGDGDGPSLDFHPVKTQQFPFSMFVRVSSPSPSPPAPSTATASATAAACELALRYDDGHGGDEDHPLPPPLSEAMTATGSQADGSGDNGDEPVLLTTSQLLPETLMESFPMPPSLTQSSRSGSPDEEDGSTQ